jgi:PPP family 3-phenylpropionic acid transporter
MTSSGAAVRLGAYYAALFAAIGIHLPFWPLWLADRGLSPADIGWIIAATYLSKIAVNPVVGHVVDRRGDRRRPMVTLAVLATAAWLAYALVDGFWGILAVTMVSVGLWAGIMPVGESLAMMTVVRHRLDYGRVRLWGSLAFIAAATLVGRLLVDQPPGILMWLVAGGLGLAAVACHFLPDERATTEPGKPAPLRPLMVSTPFLLFLTATSLNQAAHTVYYAFSTLHWKAAGIADDTIGLLWSEGVLAEIALFAFSGAVMRRFGPGSLLVIAGICGVARWLVLGTTTEVPMLAVAQVLHAATFGCAHLGAMHFIQQAVPAGLSARAQGLYSATAMGLAPGLMSPVTGRLYESLGGGAFLIMAAIATAAAAAAWALTRHWQGGPVLAGI